MWQNATCQISPPRRKALHFQHFQRFQPVVLFAHSAAHIEHFTQKEIPANIDW
jgi:hypothetical protein